MAGPGRLRPADERSARPRPSDRWTRRLLKVLGVGGFLGLLVLAPHLPNLGDYACGLAVVWFIAFGLMECHIGS